VQAKYDAQEEHQRLLDRKPKSSFSVSWMPYIELLDLDTGKLKSFKHLSDEEIKKEAMYIAEHFIKDTRGQRDQQNIYAKTAFEQKTFRYEYEIRRDLYSYAYWELRSAQEKKQKQWRAQFATTLDSLNINEEKYVDNNAYSRKWYDKEV
jgi:hypothetical protein